MYELNDAEESAVQIILHDHEPAPAPEPGVSAL